MMSTVIVEHAELPYIQLMEDNKPVTINLRLQLGEKQIIDRAAEFLGTSCEAFILKNALEKAKEVLEEQTDFVLSPGQWEKFVRMLEHPPKNNPGLDRLMAMAPLWKRPEEGEEHQ